MSSWSENLFGRKLKFPRSLPMIKTTSFRLQTTQDGSPSFLTEQTFSETSGRFAAAGTQAGLAHKDKAMRHFLLPLIPAIALAIALQARASTITAGTYTLTSATASGFTVTGTLTLNTSGYVTVANLTFNDPAVNNPSFANVASTGSGGYSPVTNFAYMSGATGQIFLDYLQSPDASGGLSLCIYNLSCNSYQASYVQIYTPSGFGSAYLSGGSLTPASVANATSVASAPEPASLLLLGTGVLLSGGLLRGRLWRRESHALGSA